MTNENWSYETKTVYFWLTKDPAARQYWTEVIDSLTEGRSILLPADISDPRVIRRAEEEAEDKWRELVAKRLKDESWEHLPDIEAVYGDLLLQALNRVDWDGIAREMLNLD